MYYRYRMYNSGLGRFVHRDPIGYEGGINVYGYVSGNPVNATDPMGLLEWGQDEAAAAAAKKCKLYCSITTGNRTEPGIYNGYTLDGDKRQEFLRKERSLEYNEFSLTGRRLLGYYTYYYSRLKERIAYIYKVHQGVKCHCCQCVDDVGNCIGSYSLSASLSYEATNWSPWKEISRILLRTQFTYYSLSGDSHDGWGSENINNQARDGNHSFHSMMSND